MPKHMRPSVPSLFKRQGSPCFQVRIQIGDPKTRKRIKVIKSTHETDYEKAKAAMDEIVSQIIDELYASETQRSSKQPIADFIEEYYRKHGGSLARTTRDDYRVSVTDPFVEWFGAETPLSTLTRSNLEEWVYETASAHQQHKRRRVMIGVLNEAVYDGKLDRNPITFRAPKVPENDRDIFESDAKFTEFFKQMEEDTPRHRAIKNIAYLLSATALRDGEVAHLERDDFDFERGAIRIRNTQDHATKNRREHLIPITPRSLDAFRRQMEDNMSSPNVLIRESRFLFPNSKGEPLRDSDEKPRPISKLFREQRDRILPNRSGLHPHSIRHSVAQNAYDRGVPLRDITMLLNHKGEGITERYYARVRSYRKATEQFSSIEEYLNSLPTLPSQESGEPHEIIQGSLSILELSACNISEVLE